MRLKSYQRENKGNSTLSGDGVISMFRSLGQFSPNENHEICDYQLKVWGIFYYFYVWTEEQQQYFVNK